MRSLLFILLQFSLYHADAATVQGKVVDDKGSPVPFASIYLIENKMGTSTNQEGFFRLTVPKGNYTLIAQSIGYEQHQEAITIANGDSKLQLEIQLKRLAYQIGETEVNEGAGKEIMEKVIAQRKFHLNQVQSYECEAYVKGSIRILQKPDQLFGSPVDFGVPIDSTDGGIVYLSESVSRLKFRRPNDVVEEVISSKVSGEPQSFTYNAASDFYFNIYENFIELGGMSPRAFVSPISNNAFLFYDYEIDGAFYDGDLLINRVKVNPKRNSDPAFTGVLNIIEGKWSVHSLSIFATKQNQLEFVDTVHIKQSFREVVPDIWMPFHQQYAIRFGVLGIKGLGSYNGLFNSYTVNHIAENEKFGKEILKVNADANEKTEAYWDSIRPIPLTQVEQIDYQTKDSIKAHREDPIVLDSLDREHNKPGLQNILFGYTYSNSEKDWSIGLDPIWSNFEFNPVEGFVIRPSIQFSKDLEEKGNLQLATEFRYGFSNKHFGFGTELTRNFEGLQNNRLKLGIGHLPREINYHSPVDRMVNTVSALFYETNHLKLYQSSHLFADYQQNIFPGLTMGAAGMIERRSSLHNTTDFTLLDDANKFFDVNQPLTEDGYEAIENNDALTLELRASFQPGVKYITRPEARYELPSKWPVLGLAVYHTLPLSSNGPRYTNFSGTLDHSINLRLLGRTHYHLEGGLFNRTTGNNVVDFHHFKGNQTLIGQNYNDGFQLLPYYLHSTPSDYFAVHVNHSFNGFLINKIPLLRKTKWQMVAGARMLKIQDQSPYMEFNVGLENIFKVLRVDLVYSLQDGKVSRPKLIFGLSLGQ